jgi:hypothetical protein
VSGVSAAPILRSADVRITVLSPTSCDVTLALGVTGAPEIDHRIEAFEGSRVDLVDVHDAQQVNDIRTVGRTRSLVLHPAGGEYAFHYLAFQSAERANRCPIWLPAVATAGRPGAVRLLIDIPAGNSATGTMPAFEWNGRHGVATLAHLPSHVAMTLVPENGPRIWDVSRIMDTVAMTVFAAATAAWVWRARK